MSRNTAKILVQEKPGISRDYMCPLPVVSEKTLELTLKEVRRKVPGLTQYLTYLPGLAQAGMWQVIL